MSDDDDPFRYCIYCNADCYADESEHAEDCPLTTGVFPVTEEDLKPICPHCGESMGGLPLCSDCGAQLSLGDHYMHRELDPGDESLPGIAGAAVYEVICVGCAAKEALSDGSGG